ncbi:hypothetical protein Q8A73_022640 [Channa argus]|nr:hypothetical protein Q8A73_022640 [Channa argus]
MSGDGDERPFLAEDKNLFSVCGEHPLAQANSKVFLSPIRDHSCSSNRQSNDSSVVAISRHGAIFYSTSSPLSSSPSFQLLAFSPGFPISSLPLLHPLLLTDCSTPLSLPFRSMHRKGKERRSVTGCLYMPQCTVTPPVSLLVHVSIPISHGLWRGNYRAQRERERRRKWQKDRERKETEHRSIHNKPRPLPLLFSFYQPIFSSSLTLDTPFSLRW